MSDSESSDEDEILIPNGYVDVFADLVNTDFDPTPPLKKARGRKRTADAQESFNNSFELGQGPHSSIDVPQNDPSPVLDDSCLVVEEEVTLEEICERVRRNENNGTTRKSRRIAGQSLDESITVQTSPDASPEHKFDLSMNQDSSLFFDVEDETFLPDPEDPNVEMSIRAVWKGCSTRHFTIRKFQKINEIYTHYAQLEGIPEERVLFTLRDTPVSPNDTPLSLNIGVSSLEGGVIDVACCTSQDDDQDQNAMKLLVQRQGSRERHTVFTNPKEKISVLISKLSEDLKIQSNLIKLKFDGDFLDANSTPEDYDLEGEECIDLIVTK